MALAANASRRTDEQAGRTRRRGDRLRFHFRRARPDEFRERRGIASERTGARPTRAGLGEHAHRRPGLRQIHRRRACRAGLDARRDGRRRAFFAKGGIGHGGRRPHAVSGVFPGCCRAHRHFGGCGARIGRHELVARSRPDRPPRAAFRRRALRPHAVARARGAEARARGDDLCHQDRPTRAANRRSDNKRA